MEKPKILYHGTARCDIEEFEPRLNPGSSGAANGPMVYATDDIVAASIFMLDVRSSFSVGQFAAWYVIISEPRESFLSHDRGGCIYELLPDTFETGTVGGFGENEFASSVPVRPFRKQHFDSALDAILNNGVQVYFITPEQYEQIESAPQHGYAILKELESENQRRGINAKSL